MKSPEFQKLNPQVQQGFAMHRMAHLMELMKLMAQQQQATGGGGQAGGPPAAM
jgi:hypothetical protein